MSLLRDCWNANPDGAGLMYVDNGMIRIVKGFMTWKHFKGYVKAHRTVLAKQAVVFHFRWATHGTISAGNCHPFPIRATGLTDTNTLVDVALAHNGVIPEMEVHTQASDSLVFVRDYLAPLGPAVLDMGELLVKFTASKFAIMSAARLVLAGDFVHDAGWYFSNASYRMPHYASALWDDAPQGCVYCGSGDQLICNLCEEEGLWRDDSWFNGLQKPSQAIHGMTQERGWSTTMA
jgi:hypothetical protein